MAHPMINTPSRMELGREGMTEIAPIAKAEPISQMRKTILPLCTPVCRNKRSTTGASVEYGLSGDAESVQTRGIIACQFEKI
jgi:hypothetical protein